MRFGTMFSGGEGAGVGLKAAGLHHVWGIEYDADIAAVAADNGFAVHVADVRQVDYAALPAVDWLHASPVCTRASVANSGAVESQEDIDTAAAVVRALKAQQPSVFTLENVWQYRTFKAFTTITDALGRMGYFWTYDHVNAADYGVPQTRRRLILRASRGLLPWLPEPVPWVGWYAAIEDLLPTLPESKLAPWQLARLPAELRESVLFSSNGNAESYGDHHADAGDPALSVTAQASGRARAVLIAKTADKFGDGRREWSEQAQTIGANEHGSKAVLVAGLLNSESTTLTQRDGDAPAFTATTSHNQRDARAVLWSHGRSHDRHGNEYGPVLRVADEPAHTCTATSGPYNIQLGARVVSMTPRCLARFQSVPDSYRLPTKRTLAARVIGNMVPPLLMQRIAEGLTA